MLTRVHLPICMLLIVAPLDGVGHDAFLVDRWDLPSAGAGETPIIGVAPAVGNAIFHAAGVRLRSLPMAPNGVDL